MFKAGENHKESADSKAHPGVLQRSDLSHSAPARYLYRVQRFVILHKYKYARLLRALRRSVA